MEIQFYENFRKGLKSPPKLINYGDFLPTDGKSDFYSSLYQYENRHKKILEETGTLSGIKDVTTDRLFFDFDDKTNIENALNDTIEVCKRLVADKVDEEAIKVWFSGNKGFNVELLLGKRVTPDEFKAATNKYAGDLKSFDTVVSDPQRIVRIPNTRHQTSNLFKIPLMLWELEELSIAQIKEMAVKPRLNIKSSIIPVNLPELTFKTVKPKVEIVPIINPDFDVKTLPDRPKHLDMARWALFNGMFKDGQRSHALLCLASTFKSMNYPQNTTYRLLKGVAQDQADRTGMERFPDNEIYNNIVLQVYGPNWRGGTYSSKDPTSWLYQYAKSMGIDTNEDDELRPIKFSDIGNSFLEYIDNFENNRVYFGIQSLDKALPLCGGSVVGVIGSAGSGKTSLLLDLLANTSKNGSLCAFASLDMSKNRLFEKVLYRQFNKSREETFANFKAQKDAMMASVTKEFENVYVFDRSAPTVQAVREYVTDIEQSTGEKVKLLAIDYFERVGSDISDDTAASKRVASEFQDIANDFPHLCVVVAYQPNKFALSGGPDTPILSYTAIKGSSFIYQSCRQIVSLWRPFFNPKTQDKDKYMEMAILKNDLGELDTFVFNWNGKRGIISEMDETQRNEFNSLLKEKDKKKEQENEGWK